MIKINNLNYSYSKEKKVLCNVNLTIRKGEIFCLLGSNGSGKTTLLKILSTAILDYDGQVSMDEIQYSKDHLSKIRKKIAVTFQNPSLDKKLTVKENIFLFGHLHGLSKKDIETSYSQIRVDFDLEDIEHQWVMHLSGGQKRRAELAKALLTNPEVLVMDEPSNALDIQSKMHLWVLLKKLNQQGKTIIFSTHHMDEANQSDWVCLLSAGEIVVQNSVQKLIDPLDFQTIMIKPNTIDVFKRRLESDGYDVFEKQERLMIRSQKSKDKVQEFMNRYFDQVQEISVRHPDMEDVYYYYSKQRKHV